MLPIQRDEDLETSPFETFVGLVDFEGEYMESAVFGRRAILRLFHTSYNFPFFNVALKNLSRKYLSVDPSQIHAGVGQWMSSKPDPLPRQEPHSF
jgi:hypothetical protein